MELDGVQIKLFSRIYAHAFLKHYAKWGLRAANLHKCIFNLANGLTQ
jgi:hypothetical protein